jgi:hypothetical protein
MSGNVPSPNETNLFRIVRGIRDLFEGRRNTTGTVTLSTGTAATTVTHANFGKDSVPVLTPLHANAAAEIGNGTMYVSARAQGSFTIAHANNATTNRTFAFSFDG